MVVQGVRAQDIRAHDTEVLCRREDLVITVTGRKLYTFVDGVLSVGEGAALRRGHSPCLSTSFNIPRAGA